MDMVSTVLTIVNIVVSIIDIVCMVYGYIKSNTNEKNNRHDQMQVVLFQQLINEVNHWDASFICIISFQRALSMIDRERNSW